MTPKPRDNFFGELSSGRFNFRDGAGQLILHPEEIFPIFRQDAKGFLEVLGTGFFITKSGIFVTAKHRFGRCFRSEGKANPFS